MLAGKVAGVNVTSNSGEPGVGTQIRIRGGSSLNASNDPLIVIDGVPMDNNKVGNTGSNLLSTINPQDIESFNVLKDASATAIYGSRGSNGVIIITTKKGHKGRKPEVSYSGSVSLSMKKKTQDVMNGDEYRAYIKSLFNENDNAVKALGTANTDWQELIYRKAVSHDHNVTVSGSVKDYLPYRVSLGYTGQQGIFKVPIVGTTIPHEINGIFGSGNVLMKPAARLFLTNGFAEFVYKSICFFILFLVGAR